MTIKTYFLNEEKTVYLKAYMLDNVEGLPFCEKRRAFSFFPEEDMNIAPQERANLLLCTISPRAITLLYLYTAAMHDTLPRFSMLHMLS